VAIVVVLSRRLRYAAAVLTAVGVGGIVLAGVLVALAILAVWVWRKGRPFAAGHVFRASRFSRGNRLLPVQVLITPTSVVHFTPQWVGKLEHSMHMAHVASVRIDTNVFFSDVFIETTGGVNPIRCAGHRKKDAVRMKALIEEYQTGYYRQSSRGS
jgi:cobalamin synthase